MHTKASFFIFAFYFHSTGNGMWPSALSPYPALCGCSLWLRPEFTITYFNNDPEMQPAHLAILSLLLSSFKNGDSHCFSFQSFSTFSMKPFKIKPWLCELLKTKRIFYNSSTLSWLLRSIGPSTSQVIHKAVTQSGCFFFFLVAENVFTVFIG